MNDGRPYTAQICENGHVVTSMVENFPGSLEIFCSRCGVKTLTACSSCRKPLRGHGRYNGDGFSRPAHCADCGSPHPWTSGALAAAKEFAGVELAEQDQRELADVIENLVSNTPRTGIAATKMKRLLDKAQPIVVEGFRKILVDVVSETVRKSIWP